MGLPYWCKCAVRPGVDRGWQEDQLTWVQGSEAAILQQLTITTPDKRTLKPLVESAIDNEKKMLALGIRRTQERLAEFEERFGMSSAEFERRLNALEQTETVELTDWRMEMGMLRLLEGQYQTLDEARLE